MENSFVKRLRKQDVREILSKLGLRIAEELPRPYCKGKNEDGSYGIFLKCVRLNPADDSFEDIKEALLHSIANNKNKNNAEKSFMTILTTQILSSSISQFNDQRYVLLDINEFDINELACMKSDEERYNDFCRMTYIYMDFMIKKFGEEYRQALEEYLNSTTIDEQNASEQNIEI